MAGSPPSALGSFPSPGTPQQRAADIGGILLLTAVLCGLGIRQSNLLIIPGQPLQSHTLGRNGMADFRDVIYYPVRAVRERINPYDCGTEPLADGTPRYRQRYPVLNLFPLYSPLVLALFWPFGYGDFLTSALIYAVLNVGLLLVLAYAAWNCAAARPTVGQLTMLAAVMLATQAGRANFLGGETALPLALGTVAAVRLAPAHPWLAGLALTLTSFKPTFGLPLGLLLLANKHYRTVLLGWGLGLVIGLGGLALIFGQSGDLGRAREILIHNQQVLESDPDVSAELSSRRVDTAGAIERWLPTQGRLVQVAATLVVLLLAGSALWRLRSRVPAAEAAPLATAIVSLATVSSIYHLTYDAVLLWVPIAIVLLAPAALWPGASRGWRWATGGLMLVPMFNVFVTDTVQRWLGQLGARQVPAAWRAAGWTTACTLSGLALLAALCLLAWEAHRRAARHVPAA